MINKIRASTKKSHRAPPQEVKYPIPAAQGAPPHSQEYFENRVRKTLRLNVVALKLANLLRR